MSERAAAEYHVVEAGDVFAMDTNVFPMVLLVMSKDEEVVEPERGPKVYFRWLAHPEADRITACDWVYEASLRLKHVWLKVATAS